jgi:hypothetical protein
MKAMFAALVAALAIGGAASAQEDPDQSFTPGPPPTGAQQPPPNDHQGVTQGATQSGAAVIADLLQIDELNGAWVGTWTRRPGTDTFDAVWRNPQGQVAHDVIRLASVDGDRVTFVRQGISGPKNGTYSGVVSADGGSIRGTASWYQPGWEWTARMSGSSRPPSGDDTTQSHGSYGDRESQGESGTRADRGSYGDRGSQGDRESQGESGTRADHGSYGDRGSQGDRESQGDHGDTGTRGDHGSYPDHGSRPAQETQLFDNWNTAACGLTDTATLEIGAPVRLTRITVWYNWAQGEREVGYSLSSGRSQVGGGTLTRGSCDPYQGAWCEARDTPNLDLGPGRYRVRLDRGAVCQNGGSGGNGFIRAWGYPSGGSVEETRQAPHAISLAGTWSANDGGAYVVRQEGDRISWTGTSGDGGRAWVNDFEGQIQGQRIVGHFQDRPGKSVYSSGDLVLRIEGTNRFVMETPSGGFGGSVWTR